MMFPKQGRITLAAFLLLSYGFTPIYCVDSNTSTRSYDAHQQQEASSTQVRRRRPVVRVKATKRHRRLRNRHYNHQSRNRDPLESFEREGTIIFERKKDKKDKVKYVPDDNKTPVPPPAPTPVATPTTTSNKLRCKDFCYKNGVLSDHKCAWRKCGACRECQSGDGNGPAPSPTTSSDLDTSEDNKKPMCERWCGRHKASIEKKCSFRECDGCSYCTDASGAPPDDRDRDRPAGQPRTLCERTSITFFDDHKVLYSLPRRACRSERACQLDCSCCTYYFWWGFDIENPMEYPDCCDIRYLY